ncbi:hypothetical protein J8M97_24950 [Gordonia polyisoprenivorans]|nr:hypothetical protein [Gordonia polyisoprenivorans]NKY03025.1 hypothetical protein [Gordonia polyisoprenivorans]QTI71937.1 hypothetical protein J6U32_01795 [Gordonia polyisoprenivorans]QUD85918.1 hypothetical protein J8M97_24950 [Gordonia polyisoprenivorans]
MLAAAPSSPHPRHLERLLMIILGAICLILGLIFGIPILWTIGIILVVIGLILAILGATGRAVGGRAHYF